MYTGASLMPDSISSAPASWGDTFSARNTLKTAAASVEDSTAPHSSAMRQSRLSSRCSAHPVTAMFTATATVDSAIPQLNTGRITDQRVVTPPSARINTNPAMPSSAVSGASEN